MKRVDVANCPCCGGGESQLVIERSPERIGRFLLLSQRKYGGFMDGWEAELSLEVHRCMSCGHLWFRQQPDQQSLFAMYAHGQRLKGRPAATQPSGAMVSSMTALQRLVRARSSGTSLLDFGSGSGRWARAAVQAGFDVAAYEPAPERSSACDDIQWFSLLPDIGERTFNIINLEQVLEHVPDPVGLMRRIRTHATPETILRISVPDVARHAGDLAADFPFDGERMHILSPFEHLSGFCQASFLKMLERSGLAPLSVGETAICCPSYSVKRLMAGVGLPWGRTAVLARYTCTQWN